MTPFPPSYRGSHAIKTLHIALWRTIFGLVLWFWPIVQIFAQTGPPIGAGVTLVNVTNVAGIAPSLSASIVGPTLRLQNTYVPPSIAGTDTRQLQDADIKGLNPTNGVPIILFTNSGPCTINQILVAWGGTNNLFNYTNQPILSVFCDGVSNGCQLLSFLAAQGSPSVPFHSDNVDFPTPWWTGTLGGSRQNMQINSFSNCAVWITYAENSITFYGDVAYKSGTPLVTNSWHMVESQGNSLSGSVFSVQALSGVVGAVESICQFTTSTNTSQNYQESRPTLYLDGNAYLANGNEDFFGGHFYFDAGQNTFATPLWGTQCDAYLAGMYGALHGNSSYRFFSGAQSAYFRSSMTFNYTNAANCTLSNDFLITYWTYP